mmetsp:Transcript_6013/g.9164  ORF Transcript_6013/g.9164 Transcript_6013/m.9164 type:complete len:101 (-) Transcript_6013:133-435(-)
MWKGSGRSLFGSFVLENFKFIIFVVTPVITAAIFHNDAIVEMIVRNRQYVRYPAEERQPVPTNEEELLAAKAALLSRRRKEEPVSATGRRGGTLTFSEAE